MSCPGIKPTAARVQRANSTLPFNEAGLTELPARRWTLFAVLHHPASFNAPHLSSPVAEPKAVYVNAQTCCCASGGSADGPRRRTICMLAGKLRRPAAGSYQLAQLQSGS